jgi:CRISPR-associated protein Csm2
MTFDRGNQNRFRDDTQGYSKAQDRRQEYESTLPGSVKKIIVEGDVVTLVDLADKVGETLAANNLTTSQIRNVFGAVRKIQLNRDTEEQDKGGSNGDHLASSHTAVSSWFREVVLLRPKLAYYAEREKKSKTKTKGMELLQNVLEPAIIQIAEPGLDQNQRQQRFNYFVDFFEAIVAYHKKHGGREN